jgi:hypothetical protein
MAKFSQGFMDVLSRTGTPQAAMQQGQQEAPAYGSLQRNLGAAFNMDQRSRPEMASAEIDKIDPNSNDALRQSLLVSAKYEQDPQRKLLMLAKVAELDKDKQLLDKRQSSIKNLIDRATELGDTAAVNHLKNGGDPAAVQERLLATPIPTQQKTLYNQQGQEVRTAIIRGKRVVENANGEWEPVKKGVTLTEKDPYAERTAKALRLDIAQEALDNEQQAAAGKYSPPKDYYREDGTVITTAVRDGVVYKSDPDKGWVPLAKTEKVFIKDPIAEAARIKKEDDAARKRSTLTEREEDMWEAFLKANPQFDVEINPSSVGGWFRSNGENYNRIELMDIAQNIKVSEGLTPTQAIIKALEVYKKDLKEKAAAIPDEKEEDPAAGLEL